MCNLEFEYSSPRDLLYISKYWSDKVEKMRW